MLRASKAGAFSHQTFGLVARGTRQRVSQMNGHHGGNPVQNPAYGPTDMLFVPVICRLALNPIRGRIDSLIRVKSLSLQRGPSICKGQRQLAWYNSAVMNSYRMVFAFGFFIV